MQRNIRSLLCLKLPAILRAGMVASFLALARSSHAQVQPAEGAPWTGHAMAWSLYMGGSVARQSSQSLDGWDAAVANYPYKSHPWVGGAIEASGNYFGQAGSNYATYALMAGPSISATDQKAQPFAHVLVGAEINRNSSMINGLSSSIVTKDFGMAFGGGADFAVTSSFAIRGQADWIQYWQQSQRTGLLRVSAGLVFRF